jgi:hypothetical protein
MPRVKNIIDLEHTILIRFPYVITESAEIPGSHEKRVIDMKSNIAKLLSYKIEGKKREEGEIT